MEAFGVGLEVHAVCDEMTKSAYDSGYYHSGYLVRSARVLADDGGGLVALWPDGGKAPLFVAPDRVFVCLDNAYQRRDQLRAAKFGRPPERN